LFIVSHGLIHDYSSTWLDIIGDIYFKTLRRIGLAHAASGFAVAATPMCAARLLPWNEFQQAAERWPGSRPPDGFPDRQHAP
jgi:hypothetical protein